MNAPLSPEFAVNIFTTGNQTTPVVASLTGGDYVIVWTSEGQDGDQAGVFAQRYSAQGQRIGTEFRINVTAQDFQRAPAVAATENGGFVVVWEARNQDNPGDFDFGVYGRRFDADAEPLGGEFQVNQAVAGGQSDPAVAGLPGGGFVVSFTTNRDGASFDPGNVLARRYDAAGAPAGAEFRVNATTANTQSDSAVAAIQPSAALPAGGFVVVWDGNGPGDTQGVFAQRYALNGAALGAETLVATTTAGGQQRADVVGLAGGRYVVVFDDSNGLDGSGNGVFARVFEGNGAPVGPQFQVNLTTVNTQFEPRVAATEDGGFVVTFTSQTFTGQLGDGSDPSGGAVVSRRFDANGAATTGETRVNVETSGNQGAPDVAGLPGGQFVVAFESQTSGTAGDGSGQGVFQRLLGDPATFTPAGAAPEIEAFSTARVFAENLLNAAPQRLDIEGAVAVADLDSADFDGGRLIVASLAQSVTEDDFPDQDAVGQDQLGFDLSGPVSLSGADVLVNGVVVGALASDGADGAALIVALNANATAQAVETLLENLTYQNLSDDPRPSTTLLIQLEDGDGATSAPLVVRVEVTAEADAADAVRDELTVNTVRASRQSDPAVATLVDPVTGAAAGYVVVWESVNQDNPGDGNLGVFAQRYDADGQPVGAEFLVNQTIVNAQSNPTAIGLANGGFVIVWEDNARDGSGAGVFYSRYDAAGAAVAAEIEVRVNTQTQSSQFQSRAAALSDGGFVIGWTSNTSGPAGDGSGTGAFVQRYNAAGARVGGEQLVNQQTTGNQFVDGIAALNDGRFVVVTVSQTSAPAGDGSGDGVFARLFTALGAPEAAEFRVNSFTTNSQNLAQVATLTGGDFVVVWRSEGQDGSSGGIYQQRYTSAGVAVGGEIRVNDQTSGDQTTPSIAALDNGGWVVTFTDTSSAAPGSGSDVWAQEFSADGTRVDTQRLVNSQVSGTQRTSSDGVPNPTVAALNDGAWVAVWETFSTADGQADIRQRVFGDAADFTVSASPLVDGLPATVAFTEAQAAAGVLLAPAGAVSLTDADSADFNGGRLTIRRLVADSVQDGFAAPDDGAQDSVTLAAISTPAGAVTLDGATVRVGGVAVGTVLSNGRAGADFQIQFGAAATQERVEAVLRALSYQNDSDNPRASRTYSVQLTDGDGALQEPFSVRIDLTQSADAGAATPVGGEMRVNAFTPGEQFDADVARLADGGWVTVWTSTNQDGDSNGVYARRHAADGALAGPEFRVNTVTANTQDDAVVVGLTGGGFVVVWESRNQDNPGDNDLGVFAQRYDAAGAPVGAEFRVNTTISSAQFDPAVTALADGGFAVAWSTNSGDGSSTGVAYQRFGANGAPVGGEIIVNQQTSSTQSQPDLAQLADGRVAVVWTSQTSGAAGDGSGEGVFGRIVNLNGTFAGGEFRLNQEALNNQSEPAIAATETGFVVVWSDDSGQDGSGRGVVGRFFTAAGAPVGDEFLVNERRSSTQDTPDVAVLDDGRIVVTFDTQNAPSGSSTDVSAQILAADGSRIDGEFRVNGQISSQQFGGAVAALPGGGFVVAFTSQTSGAAGDGSGQGVFQQVYGDPADFPALDAAEIIGLPDAVVFDEAAVNAGLVALDADRTVAMPPLDGGFANGGTLRASIDFTSGDLDQFAAPDDATQHRLGLIPGDTGAGLVAVSGSQVRVNGVLVGNIEGDGTNGAPFVVLLNGAATTEAVEALVGALGYANSSDDPSAARVRIDVSNGLGANTRTAFVEVTVTPETDAATAPEGRDRIVNAFTQSTQGDPRVATLADGGWVAVWQSSNQDALNTDTLTGVFAQRYAANGQPVGPEFRVNATTREIQEDPAVAALDNGGFVIVWQSRNQAIPGSFDFDVYAQRYDAAGATVGGETLVNTVINARQSEPAVAGTTGGGFVVAYVTNNSTDGSGQGILSQRFDGAGAKLGVETLVNTVNTLSSQSQPVVARLTDAGGAFAGHVVVFTSPASGATGDGSSDGVFAQRYNAAGAAVGAEFRVNTTTLGNQNNPAVAGLVGGGFVVVWQDDRNDGSSTGVYAQRYDAAGVAVGAEFRVNDTTQSSQSNPRVAALDDGGFAVVWDGFGVGGDGNNVLAQRFDAAGARVDGEVRVNTETSSSQFFADVAGRPGGGFVVAFEASTSATSGDGSGSAVALQVFGATPGFDASPQLLDLDRARVLFATNVAAGPVVLDDGIGLSVPAPADLTAPSLLVYYTAGARPGDALSVVASGPVTTAPNGAVTDIFLNGVRIGATVAGQTGAAGGSLRIDFTAAGATEAAIRAVASRIGFSSTEATLANTDRGIGFVLTDGSGGQSEPISIFIDINAGAAPAQTGLAIADWGVTRGNASIDLGVASETALNTAPLRLDTSVDLDDFAGTTFNGGFVRLNYNNFGVAFSQRLGIADAGGITVAGTTVSFNGVAIGTVDATENGVGGNDFRVNLNAAATASAVQALMESFTIALDGLAGDLNPQFQLTVQNGAGQSFTTPFESLSVTQDFLQPAPTPERQVNSFTESTQEVPRIAALADGGYLVVWTSVNQDQPESFNRGIFAQRYAADGAEIGAEFQINDIALGDQIEPVAVGLPDGGFVALWRETNGRDSSGSGLFARRFDADGAAQGPAFLVNEQTQAEQFDGQLVALDAGRFMAVWVSQQSGPAGDGSGNGVFARLFAADGTPEDGEFRVNTTIANNQEQPTAVRLPDGDILVVWTDGLNSGLSDIFAQRIDATGALVAFNGAALAAGASGETRINTTTAGAQDAPVVAALAPSATLPQGGFVVVWESDDGNGDGLFAQVYGLNGLPVGGETRVNARVNSTQRDAAVAGTEDGGFLVTYSDDANPQDILAQRFGPDAQPVAAPFVVNEQTATTQDQPAVAALTTGALALAWRSFPSGAAGDGSSTGVFTTLIDAPAGQASPVLVLGGRTAVFAENAVNAALRLIDPSATIGLTDADSANFNGGSLLVVRQIGTANDFDGQLGAPDDASQEQIGLIPGGGVTVAGATVSVGGVAIGQIVQTGANGAPFEIAFGAGATPARVEAVIARLGYGNASDAPAPTRTFAVQVSDGDGGSTGSALVTVTVTPETDLSVAPTAPEAQVNGFETGAQDQPAAATLFDPVTGAVAGHVVVWRSDGQDRPQDFGAGVFAQIYDLRGQPVGAEFRVNTQTSGGQFDPAVVGLTGGGFVVAFTSDAGEDSSGQGVFGRVFGATGTPLGAQFLITEQTSSTQSEPALTALSGGGFAAAWRSENSGPAGDGSGGGVFGRVFNAAGAPQAGEFRLNSFTTGEQTRPALVQLENGNLLAVWDSQNQDVPGTFQFGVFARIVTTAGVEVVPEFRVNTTVTGEQFAAQAAALSDGGFVVVWQDNGGLDGSGPGVFQQRYDEDGQPVGGETRVNENTSSTQDQPTVTALPGGGWVVAFRDFSGIDASSGGVVAQVFDAQGARVDGNFLVNTQGSGTQGAPSVAALGAGGFVVAFQSNTSGTAGDGSGEGVFQRIYSATAASQAPVLAGAPDALTLDEAAVNAGPTALFPAAALGDADSASFNGGRLTLAVLLNGTVQEQFAAPDARTQDQLGLAATGGVSVAGGVVSVGGVAVGTVTSGGANGAPLVIAFGAGATPARVERVVEALTYANLSDDPAASRLLSLTISDGAGGVTARTVALTITPQQDAFGPVNDEVQSNSFNLGEQDDPAIATLVDPLTGQPTGYVIVWTSTNQDATGDNDRGVFAQVYDISGAPVGGEFQVNTTTISAQFDPAVVGLATGGFVVAWSDNSGTFQGQQQIIAQVYDAARQPVGGELFVDTPGFGQNSAQLAAHENGDFVVLRQTQAEVSPFQQIIVGQRFTDQGGAVGTEFRLTDATGFGLSAPDVAVLENGRTVVVYVDQNGDNPGEFNFGVLLQLYAANGTPLGLPQRVNDIVPGSQNQPRVAAVDGGFVVVFTSSNGDDAINNFSGEGVYGQRYDLSGARVGPQFLVNDQVDGTQREADVVGHPGGGFTVTFTDFNGIDGSSGGVYAQSYAADGSRLDGALLVNQQTQSTQNLPAVATLGGGAFVTVWRSDTSGPAGDGSGSGVFHRIVGDPAAFAVGGRPVLDGVAAEVSYEENTVNGVPQLIDSNGAAAVSDPDSANFDGGALLVSNVRVSAPLIDQINAPDDLTQDVLGLRQGPRIAIQSGDVSVDGVVVGRIVQNGQAGQPFEIALNAQATPQRVELLVENLTYRNVSDDPEPTRTLRIILTDGDGGAAEPVLVTIAIDPTVDAAVALGTERRANTFTTGEQDDPAVATLANGDFVIVWRSANQDGSGDGIFGLRVDRLGNPLAPNGTALASGASGEFRINATTAGSQNEPAVTGLPDGGFIVTFSSPDASSQGVFARRFDATGTPSAEFRVNTLTSAQQFTSDVAALTGPNAGRFVAAWESDTSAGAGDGSGRGIIVQRYAANGSTLGGEVVVNAGTLSNQQVPAITALNDGGFLVVWQTDGSQDGDFRGVFGRRFDAAGNAQGDDITLPAVTVGQQFSPRAATLSDGRLVVVWVDDRLDASGQGVYARIYDATGAAVAEQFRVNDQRIGTQGAPDVAALDTGGFVIVWNDDRADGSGFGVFAQQYAADGARLDSQFQVNTQTSSSQFEPRVTALPDGGFAVAWTSVTSGPAGDGSGAGVFYQIYANERPSVSPVSASGDEDTAIVLDAAVFEAGFDDPDGQTLQAIRIDTLTDRGVLTLAGAPVTPGQQVTIAQLLAGDLVYRGDPNFFGTDDFLWTGSDGVSFANEVVAAQITVNPVNDAPGLEAGPNANSAEGATFQRTLALSDPDPDTRRFTVDFGDGSAPLVFQTGQANPQISHVYAAEGAFTVTVRVDDQAGAANSVETDSFVVTVLNAPPRANSDFQTVSEDAPGAPLNALANDTDPGADPITLTRVNGAAFTPGVAIALASGATVTVNAQGRFVYNPNGAFERLNADQFGSDSFTYAIADNAGATDTATVFLSIDGQNDTPVARNDALTANSDTAIVANLFANNGAGADSDVDQGDVLSVTALNGVAASIGQTIVLPSGATVRLQANGTLNYDPTTLTTLLTQDSFTYTVSDGRGEQGTATVTVAIVSVNVAPDARNDALTLDENTARTGNVLADNGAGADQDGDGDTLSVVAVNGEGGDVGRAVTLAGGLVVTLGANGALSLDPNDAYEALAPGQSALETFSYTVSDGEGGTDTATVTVTITGVNDDPVAPTVTRTAAQNGPAITGNVLAAATDVDDGDALSVVAVNGAAGAVAGALPLAGGGLVTIGADGAFSFDPDGDFTALAAGQSRQVSVNFTVGDRFGGLTVSTLRVTVNGANDEPVARNDAFLTSKGVRVEGSVFADNGSGVDADPDQGDVFFVSAVNGVAGDVAQTVTLASGAQVIVNGNGTFAYDQNGVFNALLAGQTALDSFQYRIADAAGAVSTATVTVTISGAGAAPVAADDAFAIGENQPLSGDVLANNGAGPDADADADPLVVVALNGVAASVGVAVTLTSGARLTLRADGTFDYDPRAAFDALDAGDVGQETFSYTVSDGVNGQDVGLVTITVTGVNDAPVARDDAFGVAEDAALADELFVNNGAGFDDDADADDAISVVAVNGAATAVGTTITLASGARLTVQADGSFVFDQNRAFNTLGETATAQQSFTYTIADLAGVRSTATARITIEGVNDAPEAGDDAVSVTALGSVAGNVIAGVGGGGDVDPDQGDVLSVTALNGDPAALGRPVVLASGATLTLNANGSFVYDASTATFTPPPAQGAPAQDSFTYAISDGRGGVDTATVSITVEAEGNTPPEAAPLSASFGEDATGRTLALLDPAFVSDVDGDALAAQSVTVTAADGRSVAFTVAANGSLRLGDGQFEDLAEGDPLVLSVAYLVSDGLAQTPNTATITITGANDAPEAAPLSASFGEDATGRTLALLDPAFVSDVDGDALAAQSVTVTAADGRSVAFTVAANGSLRLGDGQFEDLAEGDPLVLSVAYLVSDGLAQTPNTATITITGANDAPEAFDDGGAGFATDEDAILITPSVLGNDVDPDLNDTLSVTAVNGAAILSGQQVALASGALLTLNADGAFSYDPNGAFAALTGGQAAEDSFVYTMSDGAGGTDTATVRIAIAGRDAGPNLIRGGTGNDNLLGTSLGDEIRFGGGVDLGRGFAGADLFVFEDVAGRRDVVTILDFEVGVDALDFGGRTATLVQTATRTAILLDGPDRDTIILQGVGVNDGFTL